MERFFTGTTTECFNQILSDGFISTDPPNRVWEDYSENYIYMIETEDNYGESFQYAAEQSAFAVYEFNHTKRIILELKDLDLSAIEVDTDITCFNSKKYPFNISLEHIENVYIEKRNCNRKLKELIAITKLFEKKKDKELINYGDTGMTFKEICSEIDIPFINYIQKESIYKDDLEMRYLDLLDWHRQTELFKRYSLKDFLKKEQRR